MSEILEILNQCGGVLTNDHFIGTSGLHLDTYINKDALYPHTDLVSKVGEMMAKKHVDEKVEIVVGPALGGIILSQWTAFHLSKLTDKKILSLYTEKDENSDQILRRGYEKKVKNKRILIVEDITTTGGSVKKVIKSIKSAGGNIVAVEVMVNRDAKNIHTKSMGAPFSSLCEVSVGQYEENICPMCHKGLPVNIYVGHGKEYLARKGRFTT